MRGSDAAPCPSAPSGAGRPLHRPPERDFPSPAPKGEEGEGPESGGLPLLLLFLAYLLVLSLAYRDGSVVLSGDAEHYLRQSRFALSDLQFWVRRPFVVPLFYRLFGPSPLTLVAAQVLLHAAAWGCLALSLARLVRPKLLRGLALAGVLLFSLAEEVSLWNLNLLSESVAHSLWALSVAALLAWTGRAEGGGREGTALIAFLAFAVLWAFTRDTHAYVLLATSLPVAGSAWLLWKRGVPWGRAAAVAGLFLAVFGLGQAAMERSERTPWTYSLTTVVCQRVLTDGEARSFFLRQGMPESPVLEEFRGRYNAYMANRLSERPDLSKVDPVFDEWVLRKGRAAYLKYVLSHPAAVLGWLWRERKGALSPVLDTVNYGIAPATLAYLPALSSSAPWPPLSSRQAVNGRLEVLLPLFRILNPPGEWPVWGALLLALACGLVGRSRRAWVPLVLWGASFLEAVVVVLADPGEIDRHAAGAAMGFRVALWLAVLFLADELWERRRGGREEGARGSPWVPAVLAVGPLLPLGLFFAGFFLVGHRGDSYLLDRASVDLLRAAGQPLGVETGPVSAVAVPLLWARAFGANPLAMVLAQTALLCAAWAFLTGEVRTCLPGRRGRGGAALLLLALGLTPAVAGWAYAVSPVPLALSGVAFLLALLLRASRRWGGGRTGERAALGAGILAAVLFLAGCLVGEGPRGGSLAGELPPPGGRVLPGRGLALAFYRLEAPPPRMSFPERQRALERRGAGEALFGRRFLPELSSDGRGAPWPWPARLAAAFLFPAGPWVPPAALALLAAAAGLLPARERSPFLLLGALGAAALLAGWVWGRSAALAAAAETTVRVAAWTGLLSLLLSRPVFAGRRGGGGGEERP